MIGKTSLLLSFLALSSLPAERLVTIDGAVTEIVFALGKGDQVVATDRSSTWPPEVIHLPQVGYVRTISAEGVLSVEPDHIITSSNLQPSVALDQLRKSGVEMTVVTSPTDPESLYEAVAEIGEAVGDKEGGEALVTKIKSQVDEARRIRTGDEGPTGVFLLAHMGGGMVAGGDTAAAGFMELVGIENRFDGPRGYATVSPEALIALAPEVILVGIMPGQASDREKLLQAVGLEALADMEEIEVIPVDITKCIAFGPRVGEGAVEVSEILYGSEGS